MPGQGRYSQPVRAELLACPRRDRPVPGPGQGPGRDRRRVDDQAVAAAALQLRSARPGMRWRPGVLRGARAHPQGEFARTVNLTASGPGGVPRSVRNNPTPHPGPRPPSARSLTPSRVSTSTTVRVPTTRSSRVGTEDLLHPLAAVQEPPRTTTWCARRHWRYDTEEERAVLTWPLVTTGSTPPPTINPRVRHPRRPQTPHLRPAGHAVRRPADRRRPPSNSAPHSSPGASATSPASSWPRTRPNSLLASFPSALPDVRKGIRIKA